MYIVNSLVLEVVNMEDTIVNEKNKNINLIYFRIIFNKYIVIKLNNKLIYKYQS